MKSHPDPWNLGADVHQHSHTSHESTTLSPVTHSPLSRAPKPFHVASDHSVDAHSTRYTPHHRAAANNAGWPYPSHTSNTYTENCWKQA